MPGSLLSVQNRLFYDDGNKHGINYSQTGGCYAHDFGKLSAAAAPAAGSLRGRAVLRRRNGGPVWGASSRGPAPAARDRPAGRGARRPLATRSATACASAERPRPRPAPRLSSRSHEPASRSAALLHRDRRTGTGLNGTQAGTHGSTHARRPIRALSSALRRRAPPGFLSPLTAQTHASRIALRHIRPADLTLKSRREWAACLRPNRVPIGSSITARIPWAHVSSRNPAPSGRSDPPTPPAGCNPLYGRSPWVRCPSAERDISL